MKINRIEYTVEEIKEKFNHPEFVTGSGEDGGYLLGKINSANVILVSLCGIGASDFSPEEIDVVILNGVPFVRPTEEQA